MHERFSGTDCRVVHHFQPAGNNAGANNITHRRARFDNIIKRRQHHLRALGLGQQLHGNFYNHAQQTFRACHERQQIIAR